MHLQLGPMHFFGEMSLLIGDRRSATATAMTDVECVELPKEALFSVLISEPQIILNIAQLISQVCATLCKEQLCFYSSLRLRDVVCACMCERRV
jgi:hypothetical protein